MLSAAVQDGVRRDEQTGLALYAVVGAMLCAAWLAFFHYLRRHPELLHDHVDPEFFVDERKRAVTGVVLYLLAGVLGLLSVPAALAVLLFLPIFYGLTSHGLHRLPGVGSRRRRRG